MKRPKNISLICLVCCAISAALFSCSSDDYQPDLTEAVVIVKSDLLFEPQGRTGSVEVQARGQVTASLPYDWCSAQVESNVIHVTVEDNTTFEGRTALLTIHADGGQVQVPVQQRGMALGSLSVKAFHATDAATHTVYYIRHDLPMNLSCEDDWVHARMDGDSLIIDIEANPSHHIRRSVLEYECAGYHGEYAIAQYDMDRVLGEWFLLGTMNGVEQGFRFNLKQQNGQYYMQIISMLEEWKQTLLPVDFDEEHCVLSLHSAQVLAEKATGYDYLFFYNSSGSMAQTTEATMRATIYYNPLWNTHYASLEDGGTWGDGTLFGLAFYTYNAIIGWMPLSVQLSYPYILWLGAEAN